MARQDKNKHRPKKLGHKLQLRKFSSESRVTRRLAALRKLIVRCGHMLKSQSKFNMPTCGNIASLTAVQS